MSAGLLATIGLRWGITAAVLLGAGGAWFLASQGPVASARATAPTGTVRPSVARLTVIAAALAACGMLVGLAASSAPPPGIAWWTRMAGLALIATLPLFTHSMPWVPLVGAVLIALSFALVGHGTHEPRWLMTTLVVVHVAVAGFWTGALWPLYQLAGEPSERARAALAAERFGRQASWAVGALIVAGIVLSALLLGSVSALFTTSFGWVLMAKLALVAALLALAAHNRWRLVPALSGPDEGVAATAAHRLRRSIRMEVVAFLAIALATAVLTTATRLSHAH